MPRSWVLVSSCLVCLTLLAVCWFYPKVERVDPSDPDSALRQYYGFALCNGLGLLGKHSLRIETFNTVPEDGVCTITLGGGRKHAFVAHYPDGRTRAEGFCTVSVDENHQPTGINEVVDGTFFSPDGNTVTKIASGTGTETFWTADGTKIWEAIYDKGIRTQVTVWHRNGQLSSVHMYRDGKRDGVVAYYAPNGSLKGTIVFRDGLEVSREMAKGADKGR